MSNRSEVIVELELKPSALQQGLIVAVFGMAAVTSVVLLPGALVKPTLLLVMVSAWHNYRRRQGRHLRWRWQADGAGYCYSPTDASQSWQGCHIEQVLWLSPALIVLRLRRARDRLHVVLFRYHQSAMFRRLYLRLSLGHHAATQALAPNGLAQRLWRRMLWRD